MRIRLKYLIEDPDRHGNVRLYVRVPGQGKVRIRERPGTEAFMAAYHAALGGVGTSAKFKATLSGSFGALCKRYYVSSEFQALDASTQDWRRRALDLLCAAHADKPVVFFERRHVRRLRDELRSTPAAANKRLKALRALFAWATDAEEAPHDPTIGVKQIRYATVGHHAWTPDEIEQFKARHPLGMNARLALDLLRFTTGRREDVVRLGPQHVRDGRVRFRQAKNEHRNPVDIDIPLDPELRASIEATPSSHLTFLVTAFGRPFTPAGFGNAMRDWCDQAGLHHCSAHGLRKSTPIQMAEHGATTHELMAVTGHKSLSEIERYTRDAQRRKLADAAFGRWGKKRRRGNE